MNKEYQERATQNDYLWNGSGEPDPEIQRLEHALGRFRHDRPAPVWPRIEPAAQRPAWWSEIARSLWTPRFAAAALVLFAVAGSLWLLHPWNAPLTARTGWDMELTVAPGQPENNGARVVKKKARLQVGETLETDAASTASIAVAEIGRLQVEPLTRLRLLQSATGRKRIALDRGTIHAVIWAPPGQFVVDTPSAIAVDLGCMYTLHIDDTGSGILRTTLGWVGFQRNARESFIPAGAACATHARSGPGTPYFEDASGAFRSALSQLDLGVETPAGHNAALATVLKEARPRDALTLWHLLTRVSGAERAAVYDRLAALVPPPHSVTREGILRLDREMLDSWWNALDLGDISIWRHWEQSWTGPGNQPK
jgi:hypothetical protein